MDVLLLAARAEIVYGTILSWLMVFAHAQTRGWRKKPAGAILMMLFAALAIVFSLWSIAMFAGSTRWFAWIRVAGVFGLLVALTSMHVLQLRGRSSDRREERLMEAEAPEPGVIDPTDDEIEEAKRLPMWSDHRGDRDRDPTTPHPWRGESP